MKFYGSVLLGINSTLTFKRAMLPYLIRNFIYCLFYPLNFFTRSKSHLNLLRDSGFVKLPTLDLSLQDCLYLRNFLDGLQVTKLADRVTGNISKITYPEQDLINFPLIQDIATSSIVMDLASDYFGCKPNLAFVKCWATNPKCEESNGELLFHMDHHGHRCLKLFFYLTDVSIGDGQHEIVSGFTDRNFSSKVNSLNYDDILRSQLLNKRVLKGSYSLQTELVQNSFQADIREMLGPAGTCFIEDTYTLHRGTPITNENKRIILQFLYVPYVLKKDQRKNILIFSSPKINPSFINITKESYSFESTI